MRRWEKDVKRRMLTMPEEDAHYERGEGEGEGEGGCPVCRAPRLECPVWAVWVGRCGGRRLCRR